MTPGSTESIRALAYIYFTGDRVRVRRAFPPGHVRTPYYLRGCVGIVERICGVYPNPEELAYARIGSPFQPLYRVRFRQKDVWPDYSGSDQDTLDVEVYQHWLEPLPEGSGCRFNFTLTVRG